MNERRYKFASMRLAPPEEQSKGHNEYKIIITYEKEERRRSGFVPLDPCLAARYVKLKAGEEITIKAPDFLIKDKSIIIYRDRRV